jgi:hypothetical protein
MAIVIDALVILVTLVVLFVALTGGTVVTRRYVGQREDHRKSSHVWGGARMRPVVIRKIR